MCGVALCVVAGIPAIVPDFFRGVATGASVPSVTPPGLVTDPLPAPRVVPPGVTRDGGSFPTGKRRLVLSVKEV